MGHDTSAGHPYPPDAQAGPRPAATAVPRENVLRWRQVLRGEGGQLAALRRWLTAMLPDCPARDDVLSVATELASNALRHTASGRGGWFAVEVTRYQSVVRVAVADQGGPAEPRVIEEPDAEHGRGLLMVRGFSIRTGVTGDQRGRLVWADIAFDELDGGAAAGDPYEAAIRDGQAVLARRFSDTPAWFGRSTLTWWAMAGSRGLVSAPTAQALAGLLYRLHDEPPAAAQPPATQQVRNRNIGDRHARSARRRPGGDPAARRERPDPASIGLDHRVRGLTGPVLRPVLVSGLCR